MTLSMPRPPHRLDRLHDWMSEETARLRGRVRYGQRQPPLRLLALLRWAVGARARSRRRANADRDARRGSDRRARRPTPTTCSATASAGSGSTSTPSPTWSPPSPRSPPSRRHVASGSRPRFPARRRRSPPRSPVDFVSADAILHRIRLIKDWDELEKINTGYELCWLGQDAVGKRVRSRRIRDRAVHGRAVDGADCVGRADRIRLRPSLGVEHRRGVLPDSRRRDSRGRGGRPGHRRRRRPHGRLLGRYGRDVRRGIEHRGRSRTGRARSRSSSRPGRSSFPARPVPRCSPTCTPGSSSPFPEESCRITAATQSGSPRSRIRT